MNDPKGQAQGQATTQKQTLVEEGTNLKGSISSTCPIVVMGSVEGNVDAPAVTVSATGAVSGTVAASGLKSAGKLSGTFDVDTATLSGTIANETVVKTQSLDAKLTAAKGKIQLTFGADKGSRSRS